MYAFSISFLPVIIFCIPAVVLVCLLKYREFKYRKEGRRNPLTSDLLRSPGESLRERIDELSNEIDTFLMLSMISPLLIYAIFVSQSYFLDKTNLINASISIITGISITIYFLCKLITKGNLRRRYLIGLDAESAVGQELNFLMRQKFWVFHDFPAEKFNIDHVVIGKSGVFAVETKGRSKPSKSNGKAEVFYDGRSLRFPDWEERKPLEQTLRQAKWLEDWLSKAVGEQIDVKPVLALPGWFINNKSNGGVPVINGKNSESFFSIKKEAEALSETLQQRVAHQIEQRCRNVVPKAYKLNKA